MHKNKKDLECILSAAQVGAGRRSCGRGADERLGAGAQEPLEKQRMHWQQKNRNKK